MLRTHFYALVLGLVLLAVAVVTGNQLFGEPVESAPTVPVEQHIVPTSDTDLVLALA